MGKVETIFTSVSFTLIPDPSPQRGEGGLAKPGRVRGGRWITNTLFFQGEGTLSALKQSQLGGSTQWNASSLWIMSVPGRI